MKSCDNSFKPKLRLFQVLHRLSNTPYDKETDLDPPTDM